MRSGSAGAMRHAAVVLLALWALPGCRHLPARHWPWHHAPAAPAAAVHELDITGAAGTPAPFPQYWKRNTLVVDLSSVSGSGGITLTPAAGTAGLRFAINVLTRLRVCTADGRVDLTVKGPPPPPPSPLRPWFAHARRASRDARVIFGHWSALGLVREPGLVGLDTGCVWGGALSAVDLDSERPAVCVPCAGYQALGTD